MVATDLPSICRWKARFHPKPGSLFTTTRPSGGLACTTLLVEIAHTKARIRRALLPKLRLDLMADNKHKTRFSPVPDVDNGRVIQLFPENDCRYPEGYHAFSRKNVFSAAWSQRKMLRSAFRILS